MQKLTKITKKNFHPSNCSRDVNDYMPVYSGLFNKFIGQIKLYIAEIIALIKFGDLADAPPYTGETGKILACNGAEDGLEFIDPPAEESYYDTIENNGTPFAQQPTLNFIGATVANNPGNNSTDVTISGGGNIQQGPFTEIATISDFIAKTQAGGNTTVVNSMSGHYYYWATGKTLTVVNEFTIVLDGPIGAVSNMIFEIKIIPTLSNLSTGLASAASGYIGGQNYWTSALLNVQSSIGSQLNITTAQAQTYASANKTRFQLWPTIQGISTNSSKFIIQSQTQLLLL